MAFWDSVWQGTMSEIGKILGIAMLISIRDLGWQTDLRSSDQGLHPVLSKFGDDGMAFANLQRTNDSNIFNLHVKTYSLDGELRNNCSIDSIELLYDVHKFQLLDFGKSNVVVSFLLDNNNDVYLQLYVMNIEDCKWYTKKYEINSLDKETEYVPRYSVLPGLNNTADLFVWSASSCRGVCRFSISGPSDITNESSSATAFITDKPHEFWKLILVDPSDPSKGYYYITKSNVSSKFNEKGDSDIVSKIHKLAANGTVLKSIDTDFFFNFHSSYSNDNGHLGIHALTNIREQYLGYSYVVYDSSLNEKYRQSNFTNLEVEFVNVKDDGFLLIRPMCTRDNALLVRQCVSISKYQPGQKIETSTDPGIELFEHYENEKDQRHQGFLFGGENKYCTGISKLDKGANGTLEGVIVDFKCIDYANSSKIVSMEIKI